MNTYLTIKKLVALWFSSNGRDVQIVPPAAPTATNTFNLPDISAAGSDTLTANAASQTLTNKTISGASNTITNVSLTSGVTGTLPIGSGGTGQTTQQAALNALAGTQTANRLLRSDGTNTTLSQVGLTTDVTGTLPIGSGGTGVTSVTTAPAATAFAGWDASKNLSANNMINGYATTATAAATTTLTVASAGVQFFTGATTQTVVLPVTSTLVLGQQFTVVNKSTGVVTVQSSGANAIQAMATGSVAIFTCILTSGTTAASWSVSYALNSAVGTVTSVAVAGGTTGLTTSGGPITGSGTITLAGTLAAANGGTGVTSVTTTPTATAFAGWNASKNLSANSFINGYTTTATAAATTTLTVASTNLQFFTGATTQTVVLPVTSTLVLGQQFEIVNNSTGAVTVQSSGANNIQVLASSSIGIFTCILTSGTTAASWSTNYSPSVAGSVTSVAVSGGTTGLTTSGGPITSSGTITLAGTLAVANGGTGTTTSTGSGSVVLATSPSLTTPNLGTPSAAVLTSATGLPLTTGVTGTLGIGNGGTGQTTQQAAINALAGTQTANRVLRSDGTNTTLSQVGLTTDVTGTLPVANGGTGVTSSTGSGSVVLSTSPSLTTPALGTPSSATLTNATGLPLSTGVTGTLGVSNGGTGVTSVTTTPTATAFAGWDVNKNLSANNLINGYATTATAAGTTTLTVGSPSLQFFTGTATQTVVLPVTSTLVLGQQFTVVNKSTGAVTVQSSGANNIQVMATNSIATYTCILTSGTTAASWSVTYSAGTAGTVTSVDVSGGTTGLTTSGGPVTGSGTITLSGTLNVANGGTGTTASTGSGSVVLANSPSLTTPNLGTPSAVTLTNATGLPVSTGVTGLGTNVATFLATPSSANLASAVTDETGTGALVFANSPSLTTPNLGTPSAATLTNATGLPLSTGVTGTLGVSNGGTGVTTSTGTGSVVLSNSPSLTTPSLGTPSSATLTNATGLPISTGVTGLGTGVATFLATPSSANLASAVTDETGTGALVFASSPSLVAPNLGTPSAATLTNATGLPLSTGVTGTLGIGSGGTGQTTANAALNALLPSQSSNSGKVLTTDGSNTSWSATMTNPMSSLGDTIYGGSGGAATSLPGNTATTRKLLSQTGTGSVSAAPTWDTLTGSDVPVVVPGTSDGVVSASGLPGVTDGSDASSGYVGEYVEAIGGGFYPGTNSTYYGLNSITLGAGDWDVTAIVIMDNQGSPPSLVTGEAGIHTASGTPTGRVYGSNTIFSAQPLNSFSLTIANYRVSLSSPATQYLNTAVSWSITAPNHYHRISARRVR